MCDPTHLEFEINPFIEIFKTNNLPYCIIKTKTPEFDLVNKIPNNFISNKINLFRNLSEHNPDSNQTLILSKLYSGDCLYLLICIQISGTINLGDNIIFIGDKYNQTNGKIESIQYMGNSHSSISTNVTFTCFIKTDQIIKKLKGE